MRTILIAAITLDGKIAKYTGHNVDWTSSKDKKFFRAETKKAGCVIFGSTTYETIRHPMRDALNMIMTRNPEKYNDKIAPSLLEFTSDEPRVILEKLEKRGYMKAVIGGGSAIYSLFLKEGMVDEIYLTIAPKIFGKGINLFNELTIPEVSLELLEVGGLGEGEVLLKLRIKN